MTIKLLHISSDNRLRAPTNLRRKVGCVTAVVIIHALSLPLPAGLQAEHSPHRSTCIAQTVSAAPKGVLDRRQDARIGEEEQLQQPRGCKDVS